MNTTAKWIPSVIMVLACLSACKRYDDDPSLRDISQQPVRFEGPTVNLGGRVLASGSDGNLMTWAGSYIDTRFTGSSVIANIALQNANENLMDVILDGNDMPPVTLNPCVTQYTINASGAGDANGAHALRLVKRTESSLGDWLFTGMTPAADGSLMPTQLPSGRRLLFVGDSITCGYGNEGMITTKMLTSSPSYDQNGLRDCNYFLGKQVVEVSNSYQAWGVQVARNLNAEWQLICWSGKGVYRNADGSTDNTMIEIWPRQAASDANSSAELSDYMPQAVVINLGTNDFGSISDSTKPTGGVPDFTLFTSRYKGLVKDVRAAYPNAWIFLATGPMLSNYYPHSFKALKKMDAIIAGIVSSLHDKRVRALEFPIQIGSGADATGCEWHPDVAQDTNLAVITQKAMQQALSWQ